MDQLQVFVLNVFSQGELTFNGHEVRVFDFLTQRPTTYPGRKNAPHPFSMSGHGGADYHLIEAFISAVAVSAHKQDRVLIVGESCCVSTKLNSCLTYGNCDCHGWLVLFVFIGAQSNDPSQIRSGPEETLLSHLLVFEAERSRLESRVVYCENNYALKTKEDAWMIVLN